MTTVATSAASVEHLRRGGTSVVLRLSADALPCVVHWGPDLGDLAAAELADVGAGVLPPVVDSLIASQAAVAVLPQHAAGWLGRPGLAGSRAGRAWSVAFDQVTHVVEEAGTEQWPDGPAGVVRLRSVGLDVPGELEVTTEASRCTPAGSSGCARP